MLVEKSIHIVHGGIDWSDFFENFWRKTPILYKNPFENKALNEDDILKLLLIQGDLIRNSKACDIIIYDKNRVSIKGNHANKRNLTGIEDYLPTRKDRSLINYLQNLSQHSRFEEYCIFINGSHVYEHIWKKLRVFFKIIFESTEISPSGMHTDTFIGNYSKTSFGAHKDRLDNFMFMLFGPKRMLLWHEELWKGQLNNPDDDSYIVIEYEKFRPYAISVDLEPGDVLYWPSNYWHVGENLGQISGSMNIDYLVPSKENTFDSVLTNALRKMTQHETQQVSENHKSEWPRFCPEKNQKINVPSNFHQMLEKLIANLNNEKLIEFNLTSEWLKKVSAYGLKRGILPRNLKSKIGKTTIIESSATYPIYYSVLEEKIIIAYAGNIRIWPCSEVLMDLIQKLNQGLVISIEDLYMKIEHQEQLDFEAFLYLMETLYQIHAIELPDIMQNNVYAHLETS